MSQEENKTLLVEGGASHDLQQAENYDTFEDLPALEISRNILEHDEDKATPRGEFHDVRSLGSLTQTDYYPKTSILSTTVNIVKSFMGLGILAAPYGFKQVGFFIATIVIFINCFLSMYTITLQTKAKENYKYRIKNYTDLAYASYGGYCMYAVGTLVFFSQFLLCTAYVIFFYKQLYTVIMNTVFDHESGGVYADDTNVNIFIFIVSFLILVPISTIQSMQGISYVSLVAIVSIFVTLFYIILDDLSKLVHPDPFFDKRIVWMNIGGIPYFFGISMFLFEGNNIALDIYYQMENRHQSYGISLATALQLVVFMIIVVGSFSYSVYGQYSESVILLNFDSNGAALLIQILYSIGIICSYCLQIFPLFKIIQKIPLYQRIPTSNKHPQLKGLVLRVAIATSCCILATLIPNIGQFINFQGAFFGFFYAYCFPIVFYTKSLHDKGEKLDPGEKFFFIIVMSYAFTGCSMATYQSLKEMLG